MSVKVPITYINMKSYFIIAVFTIKCQFFSIKYDSNYVSKTYITFQAKMWTEFVRAYIQIQKKSFLLNNLKVLNIVCLRKTTMFLDYL